MWWGWVGPAALSVLKQKAGSTVCARSNRPVSGNWGGVNGPGGGGGQNVGAGVDMVRSHAPGSSAGARRGAAVRGPRCRWGSMWSVGIGAAPHRPGASGGSVRGTIITRLVKIIRSIPGPWSRIRPKGELSNTHGGVGNQVCGQRAGVREPSINWQSW